MPLAAQSMMTGDAVSPLRVTVNCSTRDWPALPSSTPGMPALMLMPMSSATTLPVASGVTISVLPSAPDRVMVKSSVLSTVVSPLR